MKSDDFNATANQVEHLICFARPIDDIRDLKYPRLIHVNDSGTLRITADAPGQFILISNSRVIYRGFPMEVRVIYNEIINGGK